MSPSNQPCSGQRFRMYTFPSRSRIWASMRVRQVGQMLRVSSKKMASASRFSGAPVIGCSFLFLPVESFSNRRLKQIRAGDHPLAHTPPFDEDDRRMPAAFPQSARKMIEPGLDLDDDASRIAIRNSASDQNGQVALLTQPIRHREEELPAGDPKDRDRHSAFPSHSNALRPTPPPADKLSAGTSRHQRCVMIPHSPRRYVVPARIAVIPSVMCG